MRECPQCHPERGQSPSRRILSYQDTRIKIKVEVKAEIEVKIMAEIEAEESLGTVPGVLDFPESIAHFWGQVPVVHSHLGTRPLIPTFVSIVYEYLNAMRMMRVF